jgi:prolipoprotein diacylglyceryltransferase
MYDDALTINLFGQTVYVYGLYVAAGCLLACLVLWLLSRRDAKLRDAAAVSSLFSPILGLVFARLLWAFTEVQFAPLLSTRHVLFLRLGGFSMFGALAGALVGGLVAARITRCSLPSLLDRLVPALLAFVAIARLGEGTTALGISRPLVTGLLDNTFLALQDDYDAYLRTYLLESMGAAVLCAVALLRLPRTTRPGGIALFGGLGFGITQTLFESLRYDGHLRFSFIGLQQVLAALLFTVIIIVLAKQLLRSPGHQGNRLLAIVSLAALPLCWAAVLGIEFMIDRSEMSKLISYALYILVLCVPMVLGLQLLSRNGYYGKRDR